MKGSETINKYLDLAWERKKIWNRKVTIVVIVVDMYVTVSKRLENILKELEIRRIGNIQHNMNVKIS